MCGGGPVAMQKIKFGTDGWRAVMGSEFNEANVERLAQAFADFVSEKKGAGKAKVAVGYDWRRRSEDFACLFARVLLGNGISTVLSDQAVPTPAVSRAVITGQFDYGIAVTASHNPGEYNGIKIKDADGSSAEASITRAVEALLGRNPVKKADEARAMACRADLVQDYLYHVKRYIDLEIFKRRSCRVLMDSMHGVGKTYVQDLLKGTGVEVTTMRSARDTSFGGAAPEPIPQNMADTVKRMKDEPFEAAFVTDGDGDRIGAVRPGGEFVSPGKILTLIMRHMVEDLKMQGDVVTTVSNTVLIRKAAEGLNLKVHETKVGFKYIVEIMRNHNVLIAGEESGGLAFQNYMPERDGVLSALLVIQMMQYRGKSFEEILSETERLYGKFLYCRKDLKYAPEFKPKLVEMFDALEPEEIEGVKVEGKNTKDGVKFLLEKDAWLMFRMSGTEPLFRVYAETLVPGQAERLVAWGEKLISAVK